jgi:hypothetical protein
VQYFDALDKSCIDEVACGVRKTADFVLVAKRHAVDDHGHAIAADATYVDTFVAETRAAGLVVDPRRIAKNIGHRYRQAGIDLVASHDRHIGRDIANGTLVLVRDHHDLVDGRYSLLLVL